MAKKVILVGHCGPDSGFLKMAVQQVDRSVQIAAADDEQTLRRQLEQGADLLLFNRVLDYGFPEELGAQTIRRLRPEFPNLKMMLVSNYPDAQADAVAAGALPGFGKRDIGSAKATGALRAALAESAESVGNQ